MIYSFFDLILIDCNADNNYVPVNGFSSKTEDSSLEMYSDKSNDLRAGQNVGTDAKVSDNISDKVKDQVTLVYPLMFQKESESTCVEKYVQVMPLTLSSFQGQPNALGDASQTHTGNVLNININAMEGLDRGKMDFALEHNAEMKPVEVKNLAYVDESSKPGSRNHIGNISSDMTKNDYSGKFDFESEGITEDGSVNNTSEKESIGIEHSSDDISEEDLDYETDETAEEDYTSEEGIGDYDVEEEESDISEPGLSLLSDIKQDSDQLPPDEKSVVDDVHIDEAKEVTITTQSHSVPVSPCPVVSGSEVASEISFPLFATDKLPGQFPRPMLTLKKPSCNEEQDTMIINSVADDKEEYIETSSVTVDKSDLQNRSIRELKKMLKRIEIANNNKNENKKVRHYYYYY